MRNFRNCTSRQNAFLVAHLSVVKYLFNGSNYWTWMSQYQTHQRNHYIKETTIRLTKWCAEDWCHAIVPWVMTIGITEARGAGRWRAAICDTDTIIQYRLTNMQFRYQ